VLIRRKGLAMLIAIALLMLSLPLPVHADGDFEISDGILVKYNGNGGTVTIPTGVTSIGNYAFEESTITQITFPSSLQVIGDYAFDRCQSLSSISIPNSVDQIGESAFMACINLKKVTMGDKVKSVGKYAFAYCESLEKIPLGKSLENIGDDAFLSCISLKEITASPDNKTFTSVGGILFNKDKSKILFYPNAKTESSYTIPNYVKSLGATAFNYCNNLSELAVSNNNPYFSSINGVLYNKAKTELIRYPLGKYGYEYVIPSKVTKIDDSAFENCTDLEKITIPKSVILIGNMSFMNTTRLESITIPDKVTAIGDRCFGQSGLKKAIIGKDMVIIHNGAFVNCMHLESITLGDSIKSIGDDAFGGSGIKYIALPSKLETIGAHAFESCSGLKSIFIPDSVMSIGDFAFSYCVNLESVTIGNGITHLNKFVFGQCTKLSKIILGNHLESIGIDAFEKCKLKGAIILPKSVKSIEKLAFFDNFDLESLVVPDNVTSIGEDAFHGGDPNSMTSFVCPLPNLIVTCTDNSFVHSYPEVFPGDNTKDLKYKIVSESEIGKLLDEGEQNAQEQIDQAYIQTYASSSAKEDLQNALKIGLKTESLARDNYKKNVNREEFCGIIMKLYDLLGCKGIVNKDNPFTDTQNTETIRAYSAGIIGSGKLFNPNGTLTREQLCVILASAIEKTGKSLNKSLNYQKSYKDIKKVSSWAKDQVRILNGYKVLNITGENIDPQGNVTKEEVLVTLYKAYKVFM